MAVRILIADDNAPVRRALRGVLEASAPWEIVEAENGEDCLRKAQHYRPDLIVLDLAMPKMDGMRAARAITKLFPDLPIIMHTLHYTPRVAVEALKSGVTRVVPKVDRLTILSAIQELLESGLRVDPAGDKAATPPSPTLMPTVIASVAAETTGPLSRPSVAEPLHTKEKSLPPDGIVPKGQ